MPTFDELYPDPLLDLQDQVRDYLESKPFFAALNIISERSATIANRVAKLAGKAEGLYLAVLTTKGKNTEENVAGPQCKIMVDVSVCEKTVVNRVEGEAFLTSTAIITQIIRTLHWWRPAIAKSRMIFKDFQPDGADVEKGTLIMTAQFEVSLYFGSKAGGPQTPTITQTPVPGTAAVAAFDFSEYGEGGCTINVDGPLVFIAPGGAGGGIPAGIPTPAGWSRAEEGAVLTFTCDTVGPGHSASTGANDVGLNFTDGQRAMAVITLASPEAGAVLRYTTDGSSPVASVGTTQTYAEPFSVERTAVVRASATVGGNISDFATITAQ